MKMLSKNFSIKYIYIYICISLYIEYWCKDVSYMNDTVNPGYTDYYCDHGILLYGSSERDAHCVTVFGMLPLFTTVRQFPDSTCFPSHGHIVA